MIYTVTFNPSLDYIVSVNHFELGKTNRTEKENLVPGGKGLNVSMVLANLGIESTAIAFTGGFVGTEIERAMQEKGCKTDFIPVANGISRINVKLQSVEGTEINAKGPDRSEQELALLMNRLEELTAGDYLILAGSIPDSVGNDIYQRIMERLKDRKVKIIVDATRDLLKNVLPYHPFLIKPNQYELGELFGVTIRERESVVEYARRLQEMGAGNVLVSMGGNGAVLLSEEGNVYMADAPEGNVKNAVGAGDSMVAGFLSSYLEYGDDKKAFYRSIAAGSASAFSEKLATREEIDKLYNNYRENF